LTKSTSTNFFARSKLSIYNELFNDLMYKQKQPASAEASARLMVGKFVVTHKPTSQKKAQVIAELSQIKEG